MRYNASQRLHVTERVQRTLKALTANVISRQTIKRQSHNAQLQQHCCTRSHSSCSDCHPSAAAHARSRFRHSFTAPSIMRWLRRSYSSTMRWRSSSKISQSLTTSCTDISFTSDKTASCVPERAFLPRTRCTFDPRTGLMCRKTLSLLTQTHTHT